VQPRHRWELALIGVCALWGSTFTLVRDVLERMPPFLYIALRFALAGATLAAFGAFRGLRRDEVRAGILIGIPLFVGYATQATGQQYTSPSNAGFITGLFIVFTPVVSAVSARRLPSRALGNAVALATAGLALLAMPSGFGLRRGDALILGTAIAFSFHILFIGRLAPGRSALRLTAVQVTFAGVAAGIWSVIAERRAPPGNEPFLWFAIAVMGIFATAVGFIVQTRTQQHSPPTRTAVILTAEPVFAGIFGYLLAGDRLGVRGYTGAALIVAAILAAELRAPDEEKV
jgi:drug/metabolite transporter (DMT)-like permease